MNEMLLQIVEIFDRLVYSIYIIDSYVDRPFRDEESTLSRHYPGKSQLSRPIPIELITIFNGLKKTFNPLT